MKFVTRVQFVLLAAGLALTFGMPSAFGSGNGSGGTVIGRTPTGTGSGGEEDGGSDDENIFLKSASTSHPAAQSGPATLPSQNNHLRILPVATPAPGSQAQMPKPVSLKLFKAKMAAKKLPTGS